MFPCAEGLKCLTNAAVLNACDTLTLFHFRDHLHELFSITKLMLNRFMTRAINTGLSIELIPPITSDQAVWL